MNTITISRSVRTHTRATPRVVQTAAMFGLGVDEARTISVVPRCGIPLPHLNGRSGIVFITGPSGSGKSTVLRLIAAALAESSIAAPLRMVSMDALPPLDDVPLVDALSEGHLPLAQVMQVFSIVGLSDAFVMLRTPSELSDGQRYRLRLAQLIVHCISAAERGQHIAVMLADEFGSTLDRITAKTIARNLRRWVGSHVTEPMSCVIASAHDDLIEALQPDVLIWKGLGEDMEILSR